MLSEVARPRPAPAVLAWLEEVPDESLHLSVLTLGEIRRGVEALRRSRRRDRLGTWLEHELPAWFGPRIVPVDPAVAERWGRLCATAGRPISAIDSLIAASALHRGLAIVTRNVRVFDLPGVEVIDPWRRR